MLSAVIKGALALILVVVVFFVAGITGVLFRVWPTAVADQSLTITSDTLAGLEGLRAERKFDPDQLRFYPGAPNEPIRTAAQSIVDSVIGELIATLPHDPRRAVVLGTIKLALPALDIFDSEERDQALFYFERVISITGIESSGELLNVWRYGFPYGWLPRT